MDTIAKISIAAAVAVAAVLLVMLFFKLKKLAESYILLNQPERSEKTVLKLLTINYGGERLLKNAVFPFNLSPDSKLFRADAIVVNRGGVLIISIRNMHGTIENPFHGDWRQFYMQAIKQMRNPLELNGAYAQSLIMLLRQSEIENVPVESLVVYLDPKTKFKNRIAQIIQIDRLTTYIHDMNNNRFLSGKEIRKTAAALREFARKPQKAKSPPQYRSNYPDQRPH